VSSFSVAKSPAAACKASRKPPASCGLWPEEQEAVRSPSGNAAPLRFARSIAAWYLLAVTAAYCLGGSRPKKSRKGGLALFAPFFDEEPKAEREAIESSIRFKM